MFKRNFSKLLMLFVLTAVLSSCSKNNQETSSKSDKSETEKISNTNYVESDEDLFTVDYKEFYDQLAPHGEWIEVTGNDVGIDVKRTASVEGTPRKVSFADFFGVNSVYAAESGINSFFVWKPAADLSLGLNTGTDGTNAGITAGSGGTTPSVGITTGTGLSVAPATSYVPFTNGQWVNSDAGWNFKAPTDYEETTSHYGRWNYSPTLGWVWLPGRVYSPAWVDWKEDDNNIAWAPLPPSTYFVNNTIPTPVISENNYIIVDKKYFAEPEVYKYMYKENKNKIMIKEMRRSDGVVVRNNIVYNVGPDINVIRKITNLPLEPVKIQYVSNVKDVKYTSTGYSVFTPQFVKYKGKPTSGGFFVKPGKYIEYKEVKSQKNDNKNEEMKSEGKKNDDENKSKGEVKGEKNKKFGDDGDMKNGNKGNKDKEEKGNPHKEKPIKEKDHEKEKQDKEKQDKEKPKKEKNDKGHDKEKKNEGKDKEHGKDHDKDKGDGKGKNK